MMRILNYFRAAMNRVGILLIVLLWVIAYPALAQKENETRRKIRVKNKVTEIRQYFHNQATGDSTLERIDYFNKEGRRTKATSYAENGRIRSGIQCEFDDRGYMIRRKSYDRKGKETGTIEYDYDQDGNRTEYRQIRDGKVINRQIRKYENSLNTELINSKYPSTEEYYTAAKYYYNNQGEYSKIENYHSIGTLVTVHDYRYYPKEGKVDVFKTNGSNTGLSSITLRNADGLPTNIYHPRKEDLTRYRSIKKLDIREEKRYQYDSKGNLISKSLLFGGELFEKTSYLIISEQ